MVTTIMVYKSERKMKKGIKKMAERGWSVRTTTAMPQRWGCLNIILFGFLLLLGKKPTHYQIVFEKD